MQRNTEHRCATCGHKGAKVVRLVNGKRRYFKSLKCYREYLRNKK